MCIAHSACVTSKQLQIRNSTAEFLIFQAEDKAQGVQVFYQDENIWATQDAIATLFDKGRTTITEHLKHIFESGELQEEVVCRKFRLTTQHGAIEGKTQTRDVTFYNLDASLWVIASTRFVPPSSAGGQLACCGSLPLRDTSLIENVWRMEPS